DIKEIYFNQKTNIKQEEYEELIFNQVKKDLQEESSTRPQADFENRSEK
ncbi:9862_t:CDS:2, partial [Racocetra persica]